MTIEQAECQELHSRKQQRNDKSPYPGIEEELRTEAPQQVGHATGMPDDLPDVVTVEEEKLVLLLIMQMMRIGQSEKEQDGHTE